MLTGAQKTKLRGIGQRLDSMLLVGQAGVTPGVLNELNRLIVANELVKLRFVGSDRHQRAALAETLANEAHCEHVGSVGNTALFYRQHPEAAQRKLEV